MYEPMLEDIGEILAELGVAILKLLLTVVKWLWDSIIRLLEITFIWLLDTIFGFLGIIFIWLLDTVVNLILALYHWSASIPGLQLAVIVFALFVWLGWKLYSNRKRRRDERGEAKSG
jgi:hypothetical protein